MNRGAWRAAFPACRCGGQLFRHQIAVTWVDRPAWWVFSCGPDAGTEIREIVDHMHKWTWLHWSGIGRLSGKRQVS